MTAQLLALFLRVRNDADEEKEEQVVEEPFALFYVGGRSG
jgi:hypothetical protein